MNEKCTFRIIVYDRHHKRSFVRGHYNKNKMFQFHSREIHARYGVTIRFALCKRRKEEKNDVANV